MRERLRRCAGAALLGLSLSLLVGCGSANSTVLTVPQTQLSLSGAGSLTSATTEITTIYGGLAHAAV